MISKLKHLSLGVLLIGLTACSNKDNHESNPAVENQTEENSTSSETASEKSLVIVPQEKLSADQSWKEVESTVLQNNAQMLYPRTRESQSFKNYAQTSEYEHIQRQLNLDKDQLFIIGDKNRDTEDNLLLDLSSDEYFKYANNLAINHIRYIKAPQIQPKQEFEKTQDYEARVQQAQQNAENNAIDYDVEILQQALNLSTADILFIGPENTYEYDADQELMTVSFQQRSKYSGAVIRSVLLFKVPPNLAKTLAENFHQLRVGYVLHIKNNQLNLEGVFFYFKQTSTADLHGDPLKMVMNMSPILKPISFKQKSAVEDPAENMTAFEKIETIPLKDVFTSPVWNFQFGLENYLSPEALLKKYPQQLKQSEPEILEEAGGL